MSRYRELSLFALLSLFWGGSFVAIKSGLEFIPPVLFAAFRFDAGAILLLGYVVVRGGRWRPTSVGDWRAILASALLIVAGNNVLLFVGQQYTTTGVAAVIYGLNPILTPLFAWLLLDDEGLSPIGVAGLGLGLLGVIIIADPEPHHLLVAGVVGKVLILLAAVCVALGSVLVRRAELTVTNTAMTAWSMLFGAIVIHVLALAVGQSLAGVTATATALAAIAYLGVFATAISYAIYFDLLDRVGPIQVNLVAYVVPVVAALAGWVLLDEPISISTVVGFAAIVAGFALVKRRSILEEIRRPGAPSSE